MALTTQSLTSLNDVKTFVVDTNVLLSDDNAINSFDDNDVVLPLIVIEELDRHKDRSDEVGRNARETARRLSVLLKDHKSLVDAPIELPSGGHLYVMSSDSLPNFKMAPELDPKSGDNQIIAFCKALQETKPALILVTRDLLLRLKGEALGIRCQDYKKLTATTGTSNSLYSGAGTLKGVYDLEALHAAQKVSVDQFLTPEEVQELYPNQFLTLDNGNGSTMLARYTGTHVQSINNYTPCKLSARNREQRFAMDLLLDPNIQLVTLAGQAGTGKTLCAIAAGLHMVLDTKKYKSLVICRPVQPMGKDIGFLPGTAEEKMEPWIAPIKDNLRYLISADGKKSKRGEETLEMLFENGTIEVQVMTFIRGRSIANAYMIIDEAQNLNIHELKTIITRAGENTKIVLTGDLSQIDNLSVDSCTSGLSVCVERFKNESISGHVTLTRGERSELATIACRVLE